MASGIVHLAITKKVCEQYKCKDRNRLNFGNVLPDFAADRQAAHMRAVVWGRNKRGYDLNRFRAEFGPNLLRDDLYLGYYLHLVQDVCHRQIMYDRYHWNALDEGNVKRLHNDYAILNKYVREKYDLKNDLTVPGKFSEEEICGVAKFFPDGLINTMDRFFSETGEGEIFFFTEAMTDEFIAEATDWCLREIEALKSGTSVLDSYDLAWENPPYSLLETTRNTRDLGGYRIGEWDNSFDAGDRESRDDDDGAESTADRLTKELRILRSDAALEPSANDIAFLRKSGVTTVIDTRTIPETIEKRPHGLRDVDGFAYFNLPIEEGAGIPESVEAVPGSYMKIAYSKSIGRIFRCIAEAPGGVIENCSAGKDRTGVISALLLWLCGVRRSDIVYDYMRTKENNRERFKLIHYNNPGVDMNIVIPRESFITDFMDAIVAEHGSIEGYFEAVGIGPELQQKLKDKLCV